MINKIQENNKVVSGLRGYVLKAMLFHFFIFLCLFVFNTFMELSLFDFMKVKKKIEIVQSAVRIDIVSLPKMTVQELKRVELSKPDEPLPVEREHSKNNETSLVEFKKKKEKLNLSNILNNLSSKKLKPIRKKKLRKDRKISRNNLKKLILEGNKLSKGQSIYGDSIKRNEQDFLNYIQSLPNKIRLHWKLPSYLSLKGLRCRIRVYIASNGRVLKMEVFESSGDVEYDKKAMNAVKLSDPLPKPMKDIASRVASGSVILGFPL